MEDIYVIKVKSRPDLSSLYPSERRYSASTVGGLSLAHLLLGSLLFFISVLAGSAQGLVLSIFCVVPFAFGLLASRRWYIDRNITFFFYASLFSVLISSLCTIISAFDVVEFSNQNYTFQESKDKLACNASGDSMTVVEDIVSESDYSTTDQIEEGSTLRDNSTTLDDEEDMEKGNERNRILLVVNVFVGSLLETLWSLLSVRIAFKGMRNEMSDVDFGKEVAGRTVVPDIILRNRHVCCSLQSLDSLQSSCGGRVGCRERVEKFLANQASLQPISGTF